MGKWNVGLPPVGGWLWKAMADLIQIDLPDDNVWLWQGPIALLPPPAPVLVPVPEAGNDWRYR